MKLHTHCLAQEEYTRKLSVVASGEKNRRQQGNIKIDPFFSSFLFDLHLKENTTREGLAQIRSECQALCLALG